MIIMPHIHLLTYAILRIYLQTYFHFESTHSVTFLSISIYTQFIPKLIHVELITNLYHLI